MRIVPEISGMQIVLLGQFNPAIFTPAWFAHNRLLRDGLEESAQVQVIHPQIAAFAADWLHLQVTNEQFRAETQQAPCLHHTPLIRRQPDLVKGDVPTACIATVSQ